jgi:DNA-binding LacI/PurR family transcriptional regulator/DNA-binding transcriptional regulator YhcF (GntR family)
MGINSLIFMISNDDDQPKCFFKHTRITKLRFQPEKSNLSSLDNLPAIEQVYRMAFVKFSSVTDQVTSHLRDELRRGRWEGTMPGRNQLVRDLGVSSKTVELALAQLEKEGVLIAQGAGRKRRVAEDFAGSLPKRGLRIAILHSDPLEQHLDYMVDLLHRLSDAGNEAFFTGKSIRDLDGDLERIKRLVADCKADAWVVVSGSKEVLEWFAAQKTPAFALFGRRRSVQIASAGSDKTLTYAAATRFLIGLGHWRIVLMTQAARRLPTPGESERAFLRELKKHGIPNGSYNLPDWILSRDGFHDCLESLFRITPPTALIVDKAAFFFAARQFLNTRGLRVPQDVSLICTDGDPYFYWHRPSVTHIAWEPEPVLRRVLQWADNVTNGREDLRQTLTKAEFVEGGTVGPAPKAVICLP